MFRSPGDIGKYKFISFVDLMFGQRRTRWTNITLHRPTNTGLSSYLFFFQVVDLPLELRTL